MLMHNPTPPQSLIKLQHWFSQAVTTRPEHHQSIVNQPSNQHLEQFIKPSRRLSAKKRLSIYVSDFWPRCIDSLADDFPQLKQTMGNKIFQRWIKDYVDAFPPRSFTLFHLGDRLIEFLSTQYHEKDRVLILDITRYEWAKMIAYMAKEETPFDPNALDPVEQQTLLERSFTFRPAVQLLKFEYAIINSNINNSINNKKRDKREAPKKQTQYCVVYRTQFKVKEMVISPVFYQLLVEIKNGRSVRSAIDIVSSALDEKKDKQAQIELESQIQTWFTICVSKGWFGCPIGNYNILPP